MDPEQAGLPPPYEHARHALVGRDHQLLDQAVGAVARGGLHPGHETFGVEQDLRLGQVEVNRSASAPSLANARGGLVQQLERAPHLGRQVGGPRAGLEPGEDLGVGAAAAGAENAPLGPVALDRAVGGNQETHRERQPVLLGKQ